MHVAAVAQLCGYAPGQLRLVAALAVAGNYLWAGRYKKLAMPVPCPAEASAQGCVWGLGLGAAVGVSHRNKIGFT